MSLIEIHYVIGLGFKWEILGAILTILFIVSLISAAKHKFRKKLFNWLLAISVVIIILLLCK